MRYRQVRHRKACRSYSFFTFRYTIDQAPFASVFGREPSVNNLNRPFERRFNLQVLRTGRSCPKPTVERFLIGRIFTRNMTVISPQSGRECLQCRALVCNAHTTAQFKTIVHCRSTKQSIATNFPRLSPSAICASLALWLN